MVGELADPEHHAEAHGEEHGAEGHQDGGEQAIDQQRPDVVRGDEGLPLSPSN